jgi:hypothetical protein
MSTVIPELHDAELIDMRHDSESKTIELRFLGVDKQYVAFTLSGIEQFRCTDFGLQNVVFQLAVHGVNEVLTESEINSNLAWMFTNNSGEKLATDAEIESIGKLVMSEKILIVVLTPSCGAQLVAVTKGIF